MKEAISWRGVVDTFRTLAGTPACLCSMKHLCPVDATHGSGGARLRFPAQAALLGRTSRTTALPSWSSATSNS